MATDQTSLKVVSISSSKDEITIQANRERFITNLGTVGYTFQFNAKVTKGTGNNYTITFSNMKIIGVGGSNSAGHRMSGQMGIIIGNTRYTLKDWDQSQDSVSYTNGSWNNISGLGTSTAKSGLTREQVNNAKIFVTNLGCNKWTGYNYMTISLDCEAGFVMKALGSTVLIDGQRYYPVIGNGTGVDRYNIQIGSEKY